MIKEYAKVMPSDEYREPRICMSFARMDTSYQQVHEYLYYNDIRYT